VFSERVQGENAQTYEIVHEHGGTFLAIPLLVDGSKSPESQWCRSNRKVGAIQGAQARRELAR
jgi:hypothetical protein